MMYFYQRTSRSRIQIFPFFQNHIHFAHSFLQLLPLVLNNFIISFQFLDLLLSLTHLYRFLSFHFPCFDVLLIRKIIDNLFEIMQILSLVSHERSFIVFEIIEILTQLLRLFVHLLILMVGRCTVYLAKCYFFIFHKYFIAILEQLECF